MTRSDRYLLRREMRHAFWRGFAARLAAEGSAPQSWPEASQGAPWGADGAAAEHTQRQADTGARKPGLAAQR